MGKTAKGARLLRIFYQRRNRMLEFPARKAPSNTCVAYVMTTAGRKKFFSDFSPHKTVDIKRKRDSSSKYLSENIL